MITRLITSLRVRGGRLLTVPIRRRLGRQITALDRQGYALVANNCVAGLLYEMAGLPKRTPTAGLFFRDDAFATFLDALADDGLDAWPPVSADTLGVDPASGRPAIFRAGKPAVVFLHYADPAQAADKWNARLPRLAGRRIVVIASLRDGLEQNMLTHVQRRFAHLFVIGPSPAPPADEVILQLWLLRRLSAFLDEVILDDR